MNKHSNVQDDEISKFFKDTDKVTAAIRAGIRIALIKHKQMGYPICVWEKDKIVWIPPEEIIVDENHESK